MQLHCLESPVSSWAVDRQHSTKKKQIVSVGGKMSVHSTPLINLLFSDGGPSNTTFLNITNRAISELLMKETETYNSDILPQKLFSGPEVAGPLFMLRVLLQRELPALLFPLEQLHLSCKEPNGWIFEALRSVMTQQHIRPKIMLDWKEDGAIPANLLWHKRTHHKKNQSSGLINQDLTGVHSLPIHEAAEIMTRFLDEQDGRTGHSLAEHSTLAFNHHVE